MILFVKLSVFIWLRTKKRLLVSLPDVCGEWQLPFLECALFALTESLFVHFCVKFFLEKKTKHWWPWIPSTASQIICMWFSLSRLILMSGNWIHRSKKKCFILGLCSFTTENYYDYTNKNKNKNTIHQQYNTRYSSLHLRNLRTHSYHQDDSFIDDAFIIHPHVAVNVSWHLIPSTLIFCTKRNLTVTSCLHRRNPFENHIPSMMSILI